MSFNMFEIRNKEKTVILKDKSAEKAMVKRAAYLAMAGLALSVPTWAAGGGRLVATQAISSLSTEVSGPLAYGLSLIMIVGAAISWYRHHHDAGALTNGAMGALMVSGVALGATSLLGFIPGVAGAVI
jgi:TrbC/VIRB2 pilin